MEKNWFSLDKQPVSIRTKDLFQKYISDVWKIDKITLAIESALTNQNVRLVYKLDGKIKLSVAGESANERRKWFSKLNFY